MNFSTNYKNEHLYDFDDDYEDFDAEDEHYDPDTYYLTDQQLDDLIYQIQLQGSQHTFEEIDALISSSDEIEVYEWRQDLNEEHTKLPTFNYIEQLLDDKYGKQITRSTPPFHNETTEKTASSHEVELNEILNNKIYKQLQKNKPI